MDASTFRWILIILGVLIIAGIFLLGNPERKSRGSASRKRRKNRRKARKLSQPAPQQRQEPTLDAGEGTGVAAREAGVGAPANPEDAGKSGAPQAELPMDEPSEPAPDLPVDPPEKIVTIYLRARDNHNISGLNLLDAALKSGLVFGPQGIFHRVLDDEPRPLFCMANITRPGVFDKDAWNTFETRGVTLFMTLPGPLGALGAWDAMLATGRRLAELLHADLLDAAGELFTRQSEGRIREDLREYERDKLPEQ